MMKGPPPLTGRALTNDLCGQYVKVNINVNTDDAVLILILILTF